MPTKGKRLIDVLNEKREVVLDKFLILEEKIKSFNPSIDNVELRWVESKIHDIHSGVLMDKKDLKTANTIWKKWNTNNRSSK
jgi:hypothetical protein